MNFRQVHLDFHTSEKIADVGARFDKKQFQNALLTGHVDSITLFSKCHHGWAYHPTSANEMHPNLKFDLLGAQIEAASEIGVKTSVYFSAGLDEKIARRHPEWLARHIDESTLGAADFSMPGFHRICMNSPYLDYLLEQIREVCRNYDADGIFLDIVGITKCYCQNCIASLIAEGKDPYDERNIEDLAERVYANYIRRVRQVVDEIKPGLPVFHNEGHVYHGRRDITDANSHLELESLPTGGWGYDHFPLSARYVQQLGKEFLGMTGKFHGGWGEFGGFKHPNALRYELSLIIANGAKCSVGDQLHPSGEMNLATYSLIGRAYEELEKKEPWLNNVISVADIGLLSYESSINNYGSLHRSNNIDTGAVRILLEGHYLFDVIDSESDFSKYQVIILPDKLRVSGDLYRKIKEFISKGGKILATGESGLYNESDTFAFDFGVKYIGKSRYAPNYCIPSIEYPEVYNTSYVIYTRGEQVALDNGIRYADIADPYFERTVNHFCSHCHAPDSGEISGAGIAEGSEGIYISWPLFTEYAEYGSLISKRLVMFALDKLLGCNKTLTVMLPAQGVATLMKQECENRYICHLLYTSPVKRGKNTEVIEDIIPLYNVELIVKIPQKINQVYSAPSIQKLNFTQNEEFVKVLVPIIDCHTMIVFDY